MKIAVASEGKTIDSEKQTWVISAEPIYYGGPSTISIDIEYP